MLKRLDYDKNEILEFNDKRCCGLWLMIIGCVIGVAAAFGGDTMIHPVIFIAGYALGIYIAIVNKTVQAKLSRGPSSPFQNRMANAGLISLFALMFLIGGPFFPSMNWRMIWLGALLATGLHFFVFYFVHGKSMICLAALCSLISAAGMFFGEIPFLWIALADGAVKAAFGAYLFFFSKPTTNRKGVSHD